MKVSFNKERLHLIVIMLLIVITYIMLSETYTDTSGIIKYSIRFVLNRYKRISIAFLKKYIRYI